MVSSLRRSRQYPSPTCGAAPPPPSPLAGDSGAVARAARALACGAVFTASALPITSFVLAALLAYAAASGANPARRALAGCYCSPTRRTVAGRGGYEQGARVHHCTTSRRRLRRCGACAGLCLSRAACLCCYHGRCPDARAS